MNLTRQEKIDLVEEAKRKLEEVVELLRQADLDPHAEGYLTEQLADKIGGPGTNPYEFDCTQLLDQLRNPTEGHYCDGCDTGFPNIEDLTPYEPTRQNLCRECLNS